jgi:LuxR family transcriptional regulator, maltose regulon positive regulatory protein
MSVQNTIPRTVPLAGTVRDEPSSDRMPFQKLWVDRSRLEEQLEASMRGRVTVVTGPPGAGKTVLLEQWARNTAAANSISQLALSVEDDDPRRFWQRVSSAFLSPPERWQHLFLVDDEDVLSRRGAAAHTLIDCLVNLPPAIVILDNFHVIRDPDVIASFGWILCNLPPHIHVVVAGRDDSRLPLQRLRPDGQLAEIRESDLRFTVEETSALFSLTCTRALGADDVTAFTQRTGGWAAGLGLVATDLADAISAAEASQRLRSGHITDDYFFREVLQDFSVEDVNFLLTASVLDRMTGEVCQELTGRADAAAILESLAARNLFVTRLDSVARWYRFHPLFADFLRRRLQTHDPEAAQRAQTSAASWFHKHGDVRSAMHYQVDAGAHDEAFALGASALVQRMAYGVGLPTEAPHLPSLLTTAYRRADIHRSYITAAELLYSGRAAEAAEWLRYLALAIVGHRQRRVWQRRVECLWALHDTLRGDAASALHHCGLADALEFLENEAPSFDAEESINTGFASINAAISDALHVVAARAFLTLHQPVQARSEIARQLEGGHSRVSTPHLALSALLATAEGRLSDATTLARTTLDVASFAQATQTLATLDARLALGITLWERHQLDASAEELEQILRLRLPAVHSPVFWPVERQLVRVMISQGRATEALRRIFNLRREQEAHSWQHVAHLDEQEARCWLFLGDLEQARRALNPAHNHPRILALIDLYSNEPARAAARLDEPLASVPYPGSELERLILMARAELALGREREALAALRKALELGRPGGFIRPFVGNSTELLPLLRRTLGGLPDDYLEKVIAQIEQGTLTDVTQKVSDRAGQLSVREREILAYLSSHRSLSDIANELYVSLNTVKSHVQALYRKLGAHTRSEAVANARARQLLKP